MIINIIMFCMEKTIGLACRTGKLLLCLLLRFKQIYLKYSYLLVGLIINN